MNLKRNLLLAALILCYVVGFAQNGYKHAAGLRLTTYVTYDFVAFSYKNFIAEKSALEFNFGYGGRNVFLPNSGGKTTYSPGISLTGSYQYHELIETPGNENLHWFAGGGLTFFNLFSKNSAYEGLGAGLFGTAGIDYKFKATPINVSVDWRPTVFLSLPAFFNSPIQIGTLGVAARYTF